MVGGKTSSSTPPTPHPSPLSRPLQNSNPCSAGHVALCYIALEARCSSSPLATTKPLPCGVAPSCIASCGQLRLVFALHAADNGPRPSRSAFICSFRANLTIFLIVPLFSGPRCSYYCSCGTSLPDEISMIAMVFGEHVRKIVSSWPQERVSASQEHVDSGTSDGALEQVSHVTSHHVSVLFSL